MAALLDTTTETTMDINEMRQKTGEAVAAAVQAGVEIIIRKGGPSVTPMALYYGLNTALCAMTSVVPFLAARPHLTRDECDARGVSELAKTLSYERILFGALIISRMHGGVVVESEGKHSVNLAAEVNFGPSIMNEALDDWMKLTNKNPVDYFDAQMLASLKQCDQDSKAPFDTFLAARQNSPSSGTSH